VIRRLGFLASIVVGMQACFFFSDFSHLDDGSGGAGGATPRGTGGAGEGGLGDAGAFSSGGAAGMGGAMSAGGTGGVCKEAMDTCATATECCGELECRVNGSSPMQEICCGLAEEPCTTTNGADCCGTLWCDVTGSSPNQTVCCGWLDEPCDPALKGKDCCQNLGCIDGKCN
jgi:hypothetical protein